MENETIETAEIIEKNPRLAHFKHYLKVVYVDDTLHLLPIDQASIEELEIRKGKSSIEFLSFIRPLKELAHVIYAKYVKENKGTGLIHYQKTTYINRIKDISIHANEHYVEPKDLSDVDFENALLI